MKGITLSQLVHDTLKKLQEIKNTLSNSIEDMQIINAYLAGTKENFKTKFHLITDNTHMERANTLIKEVNEMPPKFADGTFRQKGNKIEYRFMLDGEQLSVSGYSKIECFELRTKIIAGELPRYRNKNTAAKRIELFNDWLLEWFNLYKIPKLDEDTIMNMKCYINNDIIPAFNKLPLKKVSPLFIQNFLCKFNDTANKKYKIALVINGCLKKAFILKKIKDNPFLCVEMPPNKSTSFKAFNFIQQETIFKTLKDNILKELFYILCCTGLRIGEFLALNQNEDINYTDHYIYVHQTRSNHTSKVKPDTKTRKIRYVPFADTLIPHIKNYFELTHIKPQNYIYLRKKFRKFLNSIGLTDKRYTFHSCRHTFGSVAYHIHISPKQIQSWLGHATLDMTLNIYTELLPSGNSFVKEYLTNLAQQVNMFQY